jgi:hypothetical protein
MPGAGDLGQALASRRLFDRAASSVPEYTPHHPRCGEPRDERGQRDSDIHQRIADGLEYGVSLPLPL